MTIADIPSPNVFVTGQDMPFPDLGIPPEQGEDTSEAPAQQRQGEQQTPAQKRQSLREFLEQNPDARQELDREFLTPTRQQTEQQVRQSATAEIQLSQLRQRQDELTDRLVSAKPEQVGAIQAELRQVRNQLSEHNQQETQRAALQRQYAVAALKEMFGLTDEQINRMPQAQTVDDLRAWALDQSPVVRSRLQTAMQNASKDQSTIEQAQGASQFGQRLQQTPAPTTGAGAEATARNSRTFEQVEQDYVRGKVSFEEYSQARARNPRLSQRI